MEGEGEREGCCQLQQKELIVKRVVYLGILPHVTFIDGVHENCDKQSF